MEEATQRVLYLQLDAVHPAWQFPDAVAGGGKEYHENDRVQRCGVETKWVLVLTSLHTFTLKVRNHLVLNEL